MSCAASHFYVHALFHDCSSNSHSELPSRLVALFLHILLNVYAVGRLDGVGVMFWKHHLTAYMP